MAVRRHQSWALFSWCLWIRIPCVLLLLSYSPLFVLKCFIQRVIQKLCFDAVARLFAHYFTKRGRNDRAKNNSKIANHWDWVDVFGYIDIHLRYCATLCGSLVHCESMLNYVSFEVVFHQQIWSASCISGTHHRSKTYTSLLRCACTSVLLDYRFGSFRCTIQYVLIKSWMFFSRDFNQLNGRSVAGFWYFNQMSWSWSFLLALWWSWYVFVSRVAGWKNGPSWNFMNI